MPFILINNRLLISKGYVLFNSTKMILHFLVLLAEVLNGIGRSLGVNFGLRLRALELLLGTQDLALQDPRKQSEQKLRAGK